MARAPSRVVLKNRVMLKSNHNISTVSAKAHATGRKQTPTPFFAFPLLFLCRRHRLRFHLDLAFIYKNGE
jgi:hypothetical protein